MPLVNNKVGDECTAGRDKAVADGKALVDSLIKVSLCLFLFCFFYIIHYWSKASAEESELQISGIWQHFSRFLQLGNF